MIFKSKFYNGMKVYNSFALGPVICDVCHRWIWLAGMYYTGEFKMFSVCRRCALTRQDAADLYNKHHIKPPLRCGCIKPEVKTV